MAAHKTSESMDTRYSPLSASTFRRHMVQPERITTVSIISILLTTGLAQALGLNNLLACLCLGVTLVNLAPEKEEIGHRVFVNFEPAVLAIFFVLAGVELDFAYLRSAWLLVILFLLARSAGKVLAGRVSMRAAGATLNVRRWLGAALDQERSDASFRSQSPPMDGGVIVSSPSAPVSTTRSSMGISPPQRW